MRWNSPSAGVDYGEFHRKGSPILLPPLREEVHPDQILSCAGVKYHLHRFYAFPINSYTGIDFEVRKSGSERVQIVDPRDTVGIGR